MMNSVEVRKMSAESQYRIALEKIEHAAKRGQTDTSTKEICTSWEQLLPEVAEKLAQVDGYDIINHQCSTVISWFNSAEGRPGTITNAEVNSEDDGEESDEYYDESDDESDDSGDDDPTDNGSEKSAKDYGKESDRERQIQEQLSALDEAEKKLRQKQADAAATVTANSPKKRKLL